MNTSIVVCLAGLLLAPLSALHAADAPQPLPGYLDRSLLSAVAADLPGADQLPVTVEMRVRLHSYNRYDMYPLLTRGCYRRPDQQEDRFVFGVQREGQLFLHGRWLFPNEVTAKRNPKDPLVLTDAKLELGRWYQLTVIVAPGDVRILMDGQPVKWQAPGGMVPEQAFTGSWGFGGDAKDRCDAWIGDISVRDGAATVLAHWRFDQHRDGVVSSLAPREAPLRLTSAPLSPAEFRNRYPVRPNPFDEEEDARDLDRIRGGLAKALADLGLKVLKPADLSVRRAVLADWRAQARPEGYFLWAPQIGIGAPVSPLEGLTPFNFRKMQLNFRLMQRMMDIAKKAEPASPLESLPSYKPAEQCYDRQALIDYTADYDITGVALRRLRALVELYRRQGAPGAWDSYDGDIAALERADAATRTRKDHTEAWMDWPRREPLYYLACALRRKLAFANPLLDFDKILFLARGTYAGSRLSGWNNSDGRGGHFSTQYFANSTMPGGGLFVVEDWKQEPRIRNVLKESVVRNGRLAGLKLDGGGFLSPSLAFDGKTILFSYSGSKRNNHVWTPDTTWKIFRVNVDGADLTMLTDGPFNDFDAVDLPSGRIAFVSERRGSYIRCFRPVVPSFTLHSMKADGSDILPLSYYELNEWNPSVNNDGQLVYSRWDYTDRGFNHGATFWVCGPDGSNPRSPHGNYSYPWTRLPNPELEKYRRGEGFATLAQMGIRAIPNSNLYVLTGAGHHGEHFGSLLILDIQKEDTGGMSQLKRLTPYSPSAEIESPGRSQWQYGTPWPLSTDFFLCNSWEDIYLLDRFGNQELVCERALLPVAVSPQMRLTNPIPLKPRPVPPAIPDRTNVGANRVEGKPGASIMIANVYDTDIPLPTGVKIKYLRLVQNACKTYFKVGVPAIGQGSADERTPRIPLGIVPVEEDGSVYFQAPPGKMLMFQLLDEDFRAVHSMRSVTYVHRGELLSCAGCHENPHSAPQAKAPPIATRRAPAVPQPELGRIEPVSYYRQIKPIVDRSCLPCHLKETKGPQKMDYTDLTDLFFQTSQEPSKSGSRTIPGYYGARACKLGQAVYQHRKDKRIGETEYRQVSQWLDCNSLRLTAYYDEARQLAGELVWPLLDVDPNDPLGLEGSPGEMTPERTFFDAARLHPSQAYQIFPNTAYDNTRAPENYIPLRGPLAPQTSGQ